MAMMKRDGGQEYPASAYLVVPDADKPSTWKLRVWESSDKKVTVPQLGRAAAALGPGFRGRKVQLSDADRESALTKLRGLYKKAGVKADAFPPVLKESCAAFAARALATTDLSSLTESTRELLEAWISADFFTAMREGVLSFEGLLAAVERGLHDKHKREHMATTPPTCGEPTYDCRMRAKATFPGAVVYEMQGKLYQCSYMIEGTDALLGTDDVEVAAEFDPVGGMRTSQEGREGGVDLVEGWTGPALSEARIDRGTGIIHDTVVINAVSANGAHGRRVYTDKALQQAAPMIEGILAFANHVRDKADAFKPRDIREAIGRHRNVRYDSARQRIMSDLHLAEHQKDWVLSFVESFGDVAGNSLVSRGMIRMEGDVEYVDEIVATRSVDLVSDPATTRGLFEHQEQWNQTHPHHREAAPIMDIKFDDVLGYLKINPASATTFKEHVAGEDLRKLTAEVEKLKTDLAAKDRVMAEAKTAHETAIQAKDATITEQKAKIDAYATADGLRQKAVRLAEAIAKSDLGTKFAKIPNAVSDHFRSALLESAEDKWAALIADRVSVLSAAAPVSGAPRSAGKDMTEGRNDNGVDGADDYARAFASLRN